VIGHRRCLSSGPCAISFDPFDWWDHVGVRMPVKPGDHVVFPAAAGAWVEVEEERLLVCRVGELLGVLERIEECPACAGRPLAPNESCPVCGREGSLGSASSGEPLE
jgi:hypothetical protein